MYSFLLKKNKSPIQLNTIYPTTVFTFLSPNQSSWLGLLNNADSFSAEVVVGGHTHSPGCDTEQSVKDPILELW